MQKELDCLIQTGVAQLTRLLINSETGVSSGTSQAVEAEENQHVPSAKKTPYFRKNFCQEPFHFPFIWVNASFPSCFFFFSDNAVNIVNSISSHGRIADRLLSEGLLTPKLLEDLKTEWQREKDNETAHETVGTVTSPLSTKRSKNEMFKAVKRINRKRVK
jgi:ATP-dependent RNA helicase SUPV3L1/SUV3